MKRTLVVATTFGLFALAPACGGDKGTNPGAGGQAGTGSSTGTGSQGPVGGQTSGGTSGAASGAAGPGGTGSGGQPGSGGRASGGEGSGVSGGAPPGGGGQGPVGGSGGGTAIGDCTFSVMKSETSKQMATVGIVEWAVDGTATEAKIVYQLEDAAEGVQNRGGEAPVLLGRENNRTLLLGLKQESSYTYTIEATVDGETCVSTPHSLPQTGTLITTPIFSVDVENADAREPGFIITSDGYSGNPNPTEDSTAVIIDADSDIVWAAAAPPDCVRAKMDYEGDNMWMMTLNFGGGSGEMRYMSMDGLTVEKDIEGLDRTHHDFTVMPGGKIASMAWTEFTFDPESDLLIRSPDGSIETPFRIGPDLYASRNETGLYHSNAIHYIEEDDSFIIGDRNPNLYVKVNADGELRWQLGGDCEGAPAGPERCSAQDWIANHGHHMLPDGSFLLFNNSPEPSHIFEFDITETATSMTATLVKEYETPNYTGVLGDVQRLPGGNTLITFSDKGILLEVDENWQIVQTFSSSFDRVGYADWRPTLYGAPARL